MADLTALHDAIQERFEMFDRGVPDYLGESSPIWRAALAYYEQQRFSTCVHGAVRNDECDGHCGHPGFEGVRP